MLLYTLYVCLCRQNPTTDVNASWIEESRNEQHQHQIQSNGVNRTSLSVANTIANDASSRNIGNIIDLRHLTPRPYGL
jgi:hypothetical protein